MFNSEHPDYEARIKSLRLAIKCNDRISDEFVMIDVDQSETRQLWDDPVYVYTMLVVFIVIVVGSCPWL